MKLNNDFSFGIVQGRLSYSKQLQEFPQNNWQNEFKDAKKIGFDFIEFLIEREHNSQNPFWSVNGNKEIDNLLDNNNLKKYSICLDYIINHSIIYDHKKEVANYVNIFIENAIINKFKVIILPLLENNDINENNIDFYIKYLKKLSENYSDIIFCVETLLDSKNLLYLLSNINCDNLKCVFDTGNRVLLSENLNEDIFVLKDYIFHVHIKDKDKHGANVILNTGLVNFDSVLKSLKKINYKNPFVFETTRGEIPIKTAMQHMEFIKNKYLSLF